MSILGRSMFSQNRGQKWSCLDLTLKVIEEKLQIPCPSLLSIPDCEPSPVCHSSPWLSKGFCMVASWSQALFWEKQRNWVYKWLSESPHNLELNVCKTFIIAFFHDAYFEHFEDFSCHQLTNFKKQTNGQVLWHKRLNHCLEHTHIAVPVQSPATLLLVQHPANMPEV